MSKKYFSELNYTLANEDTSVEAALVPPAAESIASVCGSGARVLPLLAAGPASLVVIDLSKSQLLLCQLRFATVSQLAHKDFLDFWGYPTQDSKLTESEQRRSRKRIFESLSLSQEVREFFQVVLRETKWKSLLYAGKWESTIITISKIARFVLGKSVDELFSCVTMNEHLLQVSRSMPRYRWEMLTRIIGNGAFFNAMLYRGHFPLKNTPGSLTDYFRAAFLHLFAQCPARNSFVLQLLLLGELRFEEGNPIECRADMFEKIKSGIQRCKVDYVQGNAVEVVRDRNGGKSAPFQFVSMSDVPSYFSAGQERRFVQELGQGMNPDGILVNRYYIHVAKDHDLSGFRNVTALHRDLIRSETTQMYEIEVLQKGTA